MIMIRRAEGGAAPRFAPGDLVRHRRYGYRGVVVERDLSCAAPDAWYGSNQTQPERDQPWYHVLVHGTGQTTYAAQQNLEGDPSGGEIAHPLLPHYFSAFSDGRYVRNERPFGGWEG